MLSEGLCSDPAVVSLPRTLDLVCIWKEWTGGGQAADYLRWCAAMWEQFEVEHPEGKIVYSPLLGARCYGRVQTFIEDRRKFVQSYRDYREARVQCFMSWIDWKNTERRLK